MKKAYHLTVVGKQELEKELDELKSRRSVVAQKIADARDYGDLSENSEYSAARDEQGQVEGRIAEIEVILQNASLIKAKSNGKVEVGCKVTLETNKGKRVAYTVVGSVEADPLEGRISDESPIGRALMGKKVGESVSIKTPSGEAGYKLVSIG